MSDLKWPDVFADSSFEYTGTEEDKIKQVEVDILTWKAICHTGEEPILDDFERAMKKMGKAIDGEAFSKILDKVNNI